MRKIEESRRLTEFQMDLLFDVSGRGFESFAGVNAFANFWTHIVSSENSTDIESYNAKILEQEKIEIGKIGKIIDEFHTRYNARIAKLIAVDFGST